MSITWCLKINWLPEAILSCSSSQTLSSFSCKTAMTEKRTINWHRHEWLWYLSPACTLPLNRQMIDSHNLLPWGPVWSPLVLSKLHKNPYFWIVWSWWRALRPFAGRIYNFSWRHILWERCEITTQIVCVHFSFLLLCCFTLNDVRVLEESVDFNLYEMMRKRNSKTVAYRWQSWRFCGRKACLFPSWRHSHWLLTIGSLAWAFICKPTAKKWKKKYM